MWLSCPGTCSDPPGANHPTDLSHFFCLKIGCISLLPYPWPWKEEGEAEGCHLPAGTVGWCTGWFCGVVVLGLRQACSLQCRRLLASLWPPGPPGHTSDCDPGGGFRCAHGCSRPQEATLPLCFPREYRWELVGHNTLPDPAAHCPSAGGDLRVTILSLAPWSHSLLQRNKPLACIQSPSVRQILQLMALLGSSSWHLIYIFPDTLFLRFSNDKTEPEKNSFLSWMEWGCGSGKRGREEEKEDLAEDKGGASGGW